MTHSASDLHAPHAVAVTVKRASCLRICAPAWVVHTEPLSLQAGWGKKLNYVMGFSQHGVADVMRRYTKTWNELKARRSSVSEDWLHQQCQTLTANCRRYPPSFCLQPGAYSPCHSMPSGHVIGTHLPCLQPRACSPCYSMQSAHVSWHDLFSFIPSARALPCMLLMVNMSDLFWIAPL